MRYTESMPAAPIEFESFPFNGVQDQVIRGYTFRISLSAQTLTSDWNASIVRGAVDPAVPDNLRNFSTNPSVALTFPYEQLRARALLDRPSQIDASGDPTASSVQAAGVSLLQSVLDNLEEDVIPVTGVA